MEILRKIIEKEDKRIIIALEDIAEKLGIITDQLEEIRLALIEISNVYRLNYGV